MDKFLQWAVVFVLLFSALEIFVLVSPDRVLPSARSESFRFVSSVKGMPFFELGVPIFAADILLQLSGDNFFPRLLVFPAPLAAIFFLVASECFRPTQYLFPFLAAPIFVRTS